MTRSRFFQFLKDWGLFIFLIVASYWLYQMHRTGQQILDAKYRLLNERVAIAQTRDKVGNIERRLEINDVPDRLKRIETSITTAVSQNQDSIDRLAERQQKVINSLSSILRVPKEEFDGTKQPIVSPDRVKIEPRKLP